MKGLIFTYVMTYGGALLALFKPYYGFLIYVMFANIKPDALWHHSLTSGNYSRIIAIAFLAGACLQGFGTWDVKAGRSIVNLLIFFWCWLLLSAFLSPEQVLGWEQFFLISKVILPILVGVTLIDSVERLKELAWVIVLSQGYLAFEFNQFYYTNGVDPMTWNFAGLDNNCIAISMVVACGMAMFIAMTTEIWWQRGLALVSALLMTHVVLFSMSRGGMLALGVAGAVSFVLIPKRPLHYFMLVIAVLVVFRLAGEQVVNEFLSTFADAETRDESAQGRMQLTKDALDCMMRHPILGCGLENWGNIAPEYGWPKGKRVHNLWAEYGATLGIPGMCTFLLIYFEVFRRLLPLAREATVVSDPWIHGLARGVIASLAGYLVTISFLSASAVEIPFYIIILGVGVLKVHGLTIAEYSRPALQARVQLEPKVFSSQGLAT